MESYKTSWYSEEPLDLSMKVHARPKKSQQSIDSPLCMVKSCACALSKNDKQNDTNLPNSNIDESSSDSSSKGKNSEYSLNDKAGMTTNESMRRIYSQTSLSPPSPYRRDGLLGLDSRSPLGESPPQVGRSTPQHYREECSSSPSTSTSRSPFPPAFSYQSFKGGKYDVKQTATSAAAEWEYSDVQYNREAAVRDLPYYGNTSSPQAVKHEYESSSFTDRGKGKNYRQGRSDEKTTFVCMDTGKYYESMSTWYRGSGSKPTRIASPQDKTPVSQCSNPEIRSTAASEEGKPTEQPALYSSRSAVVYDEGANAGGYGHVDHHATERQPMSNTGKYSDGADSKDSADHKQKDNTLWSPASGVYCKQYQTSSKRQLVPSGPEYDSEEKGAKRFCDQSEKTSCQNWLVEDPGRAIPSKQDRYKTQSSKKYSDDWIPKFEIVPLTAATETRLSWSHGSSPFIVSKANISDSGDQSEGKDIDDGKDVNRKMCALDYLISKVLVERIDVPFKACNTEIKRIYRGECKGRLRLVDLIELQVEASLKV